MIQAKCILKFRDEHDRIYGYRLVDINGETRDIHSDDLKNAIRENEFNRGTIASELAKIKAKTEQRIRERSQYV